MYTGNCAHTPATTTTSESDSATTAGEMTTAGETTTTSDSATTAGEMTTGGDLSCHDTPPPAFDGEGDPACAAEPQVGSFEPIVEWSRDAWAIESSSTQVLMTPVVADLDEDELPDLLFVTYVNGNHYGPGVLRAMSGDGQEELLNVVGEGVCGHSGLAVGDIDGDGHLEIITTSVDNRLLAFEHDGTPKWKSKVYGAGLIHCGSYPLIADLNGDGSPEVVSGPVILNADGSERGVGKVGNGGFISTVADLDHDGKQEVLVGNAAYDDQGATIWANGESDGYAGVADFDEDDEQGRASAPIFAPMIPRASPPPPAAPMPRSAPLRPTTSTITVREVAQRFLKEHVEPLLKRSTALHYRRLLEQIIRPDLGDRPFDSITRSDVKALYAKYLHRRGAADYMICVIGSLYTRVIDDWEMADMRNPTEGIKRRKWRKVERFLSPEERRRVVAEIQAGLKIPRSNKGYIEPVSAWAIMLLMLTGHRRNEILTLTWEMIDWQHASFKYPETKTGQRTARVSSQVMALVREIHDKAGNPRFGYILRGRNGGPLTRINDTWERIRGAVGLRDVRLHDLRHSFASDALMAGVPLAIVGEMLGHKQAATTQRYAHLSDQSVRSALETTAKRITDTWREAPAPASEAPFVPIDERQWRLIAPLVQADKGRGGPPVDLRGIVDGIRWVQQRKARWREVPASFWMPTTCWRWFKKWSESGVWGAIVGIVEGGGGAC